MTYTNVFEIERDIKLIKERLEQLEKEKQKIEAWTPNERLAEDLHKKLCKWNHSDGCGWFYNSWENPGAERIEYRNSVTNMRRGIQAELEELTEEDTEAILKRIIGLLP